VFGRGRHELSYYVYRNTKIKVVVVEEEEEEEEENTKQS
jgi:hypothetical protein